MADPADDPLPKAITDEAARWIAATVDDGLSADERAARDAWIAADPRHARAHAEMNDIWAHMSGVPDTVALRAGLTPPATTQQRYRWVGPALAASLVLAFVGLAEDWPIRLRADAMTATGERRIVTLPDGSTVHLDTHSAIAFDFTDDRRRVRLLTGEAAFTVAADPARPFTVETRGGSATALGTRFLVRQNEDGASVTVTQHSVRVASPAAQPREAIVAEGYRVSYDGAGLGPIMPANTGDAMAWTEGMLVFNDRPLAEVVAEIGRYHRGYVQVVGDAKALRVSGAFRISDPVAALEQLQRSLGLRSLRLTDRLILISA